MESLFLCLYSNTGIRDNALFNKYDLLNKSICPAKLITF